MITFEDFQKLEIRIGKVISVEKVPKSDKLLKFVFDLGGGEKRQILAGMAEFFPNLEELVGKEMPLLLNIEPRKMMGLESQGMILAADDSREAGPNNQAVLLHPEEEVEPGSRIH